MFRRWVQILTEVLYPPNSPQTQTPLQRRWTETTGVEGKHEGHETHPLGWARLTGGQRLHGEPGSGEERHVLQRTSLSTVLQVVLLQLWQRDETLHHPLVLDVNLRERIKKPSSLCSNMRTLTCFLVYHAPFGVVRLAAGVKVDVFLIKLCVVHIRFLNDLDFIKQPTEGWSISANRSVSGPEAWLAFMSPAIPGSLQLLW